MANTETELSRGSSQIRVYKVYRNTGRWTTSFIKRFLYNVGNARNVPRGIKSLILDKMARSHPDIPRTDLIVEHYYNKYIQEAYIMEEGELKEIQSWRGFVEEYSTVVVASGEVDS